MSHCINANVVHKWRREAGGALPALRVAGSRLLRGRLWSPFHLNVREQKQAPVSNISR